MKPRPEPSIATSTQLKLEFMSPSSEATSGRRKMPNQSSYIHSNKLVYIVTESVFLSPIDYAFLYTTGNELPLAPCTSNIFQKSG